jgi:hypothetical protein
VKLNELAYFKDKAGYYHEENVKLRRDKTAIEADLSEKRHEGRHLAEVVERLKRELN